MAWCKTKSQMILRGRERENDRKRAKRRKIGKERGKVRERKAIFPFLNGETLHRTLSDVIFL